MIFTLSIGYNKSNPILIVKDYSLQVDPETVSD
jgi:hypothetical protein